MDTNPTPTRPVTVLGNEATGLWEDMFTHAETHGVQVRGKHFFDADSIDSDTRAVTHPAVVAALCEAAEQGWGLFVPDPSDLGSAGDQLSVIATAANLGIAAYVGPHAEAWQKTLLPGLASTDILRVATEGWRMFITEVGTRLLTTHLTYAIADLDEAA